MGHRHDGPVVAAAGLEAAILSGQVGVLGAGGGKSGFDEGAPQPLRALGRAARAALTGRRVVPRARARPAGKASGGGELVIANRLRSTSGMAITNAGAIRLRTAQVEFFVHDLFGVMEQLITIDAEIPSAALADRELVPDGFTYRDQIHLFFFNDGANIRIARPVG